MGRLNDGALTSGNLTEDILQRGNKGNSKHVCLMRWI